MQYFLQQYQMRSLEAFLVFNIFAKQYFNHLSIKVKAECHPKPPWPSHRTGPGNTGEHKNYRFPFLLTELYADHAICLQFNHYNCKKTCV